MAKKRIDQLTAGTIGNSGDMFLFREANGTTKKITWSDICDAVLDECFAEGSNITFSRSGNVLTISSNGGGTAATVEVGTTTTGAAGTNASVTNSGTSSAAVLNFTIPRGADGTDGAAATIAVGTVTTGAAGTNASVTNSGTSSAAVFDFVIPRGADGSGSGVTFYRVRYYDQSGATLLHKEYVESGDDAIYVDATYNKWSITAGGVAVQDITKNVTQNLDLYGVPASQLAVDFTNAVLENYASGSTGIDETYTAVNSGYYMVINSETRGDADGNNPHQTSAAISTTGTTAQIINKTSSFSESGTKGDRDASLTVALVYLEAGQTVTLSNSHNWTHYSQAHLIFPVTVEGTLTDNTFSAYWARSAGDGYNSVTISDTGKFILFVQSANPYGVANNSATITGVTSSNVYQSNQNGNMITVGEFVISNNAVLNTADIYNYVSKVYASWEV